MPILILGRTFDNWHILLRTGKEMRNIKKSIALETLGCKLNQAESESLAWQLSEMGYSIVPASDGADIYILNTCTVTHIADRKSRHLLRLARRRNPSAFIIATGCYTLA